MKKDITIISDIHLGSGRNPNKGTYSRHEEFFYDAEFHEFIKYLIKYAETRQNPHLLVLNGDILDYLAVKEIPSQEDLEKFNLNLTKNELKYGLGSEEEKAIWKTRTILNGHKEFFIALAEFLINGHKIIYVRGNHDLELYWKSVFPEIKDFIKNLIIEQGATGKEVENITMKEWFHIENGEIYIEHGNQYENTNALSEQLKPELPQGAYGNKNKLLNYPIGSLFARYVYSQVRNLDPYRTHVISFAQYLSITSTYNLWDFFRTLYFNFPFFVRAARNSFETDPTLMKNIRTENENLLISYAKKTGISKQQIKTIDTLKAIPLGQSGYDIFMEMFKPFIKQLITFSLLIIITIFGWFFIFTGLSSLLETSILGKASIMAILAVLTFTGIFAVFTKLGKIINSFEDPLVKETRNKAEKISKILNVKFVVMGHTHIAEKVEFSNGATYINTGAWIMIPGPWDFIKKHARQFTFAQYENGEMNLYRWDITLKQPSYPIILSPSISADPIDKFMGEDFIHQTKKD